MRYLTAEEVLNIHSVIVEETGGVHGVRERGALAGIEALPKQAAFGKELYPGLFQKAAVYLRNIILGHPFIDGNKRTAFGSADVFLQLNGYHITVRKGGIEETALSIVTERWSLERIAEWLEAHAEAL